MPDKTPPDASDSKPTRHEANAFEEPDLSPDDIAMIEELDGIKLGAPHHPIKDQPGGTTDAAQEGQG